MKKFVLNLCLAGICLSASAFERPEYAPPYVPPVATGDAIVSVGEGGAELFGAWTVRLDDEKKPIGEKEEWFDEGPFADKIDLPDALQNAGFGSPVTVDTEWMGVSGYHLWFTDRYEKYRQPGNIKVPFFLQPERRFIGDAWYQKTITIEEDRPADKDLILTMERPHWSSTVWFDGREIGTNDSLGVPHVYNLGRDLEPGEHNLVVKVNNTLLLPVGPRAHSVSDETQGAWNGIIGEINLSWRNPVFIENVKIATDYRTRTADVAILIQNDSGSEQRVAVKVGDNYEWLETDEGQNLYETQYQFPSDAELWSEFNPALHEIQVQLRSDWGIETDVERLGIRNIVASGTKILINGRETFMRGTLDCCIFPLTGYPPTDKESWLEHLGKMRASGINHVRFHSWCPPKAAFEAGDELGMYLMPEIHIWGDPSNPAFGTWVSDEGKRIIDEYGNHPSFCFFTHGNEPWRGEPNASFLSDLTKEMKAYDSRMLHTASANTIQSEHDEFICTTQPRGPSGWKGRGYKPNHKKPFIQHEPGQWCAYPNFDEMVKYTGPLKPKNFEIFLEQAEENGVLPQWKDFLYASGKLQMLCYKEDCEAALASEGIAGTQLLGISDFSGQGTALVGYLDAFLDEKGYFTKEQFQRFWNWSVPLARMSSYIYRNSDILEAPVIHAYFGEEELTDQTLLWEIADHGGTVLVSGSFENVGLKSGRNAVGNLSIPLADLPAPANYTLTLRLEGSNVENHWDFLVCEDDPEIDYGKVVVAHKVDDALANALQRGESVLFIPDDYSLAHPKMSFQPVYWNRFLFSHNNDRVTLGTLIDDKHPIFDRFPTENHSTWNWENIFNASYGLAMENLPDGGMIVQPIDDWNRNRRLGFIFEYKVGPGKLLVCMADLPELQKKDPAAKQLLSSVLDYMNGDAFKPEVKISLRDLSDAIEYASNTSTMLNLGASVEEVSHAWKKSGSQAIDGDNATGWNGKFTGKEDYIIFDLGKNRTLQGILISRTNIKELEVFHGNDLENLRRVTLKDHAFNDCSSLSLPSDAISRDNKIGFSRESSGRYLKINIKGIHGNSIKFGEMDVIFIIM
ncbi:MAG: hypothetical protein AAGJ81_06835 [Verrucomicrobiota bacterium]